MKTRFYNTQSHICKHWKLGLSYCLSLASVLALSTSATARPITTNDIGPNHTEQTLVAQQNSSPSDATETTSTSSDSSALRLSPSYSINFTEGAGHEGFASFGGFFPIFQTPGENVTFLEGRVSVDTDGDFGGGLQAGYRTLLNDSTILGAYAGLDALETGNGTFTQAGVGAELLGGNWDLTLNANLPLGNARQVVDSATQAVNPEFVNNQLLIDEQQVDQIEAALTTVSLDGGLELFDFGGNSSLWGRGGVYFLGGEASEDSLGFRASLDYRATNNLRFGAGVQNDGIFGTNAIFSVNASLGNRSRRSYGTDENLTEGRAELWARAADPIIRTNTVLVENQNTVEIVQEGVAAVNPETDREFVFRHVDPDVATAPVPLAEEIASAREATFEDPVRTIAQAAVVADANADNIIFVQEGNAGGGFTLPDGVQVRSVGPLQQVNTQFGEITLPGSGSGILPTVTGTAFIGDNSLVSGLEIDPSAREVEEITRPVGVLEARRIINGIVSRGENITLEDNVIRNVNNGINLTNVDGTVSIVRNQILNTNDEGIFFGNITDENNVTVTIADNTLETIDSDGIAFDFIDGIAIANITVANNQITDTQGTGISFNEILGSAVATIAVEGNIINAENGNADEGIEFGFIENDATVDITISGNQLSNIQGDNIFFDDIQGNAVATITVTDNVINGGKNGVEFRDIEDGANATITISNNQINDVTFEGIDFFDIENDTISTISITNNQITSGQTSIDLGNIENRADATINIAGNTLTSEERGGIFVNDLENDTTSNILIEENIILGAGEEGIEVDDIENNANATIRILNNQISNVDKEGITFGLVENRTTSNITVSGNTITDVGADGIRIDQIEDDANATVRVTNNTITNPGGDGVSIEHTADTDICLALDNNTVTTPGGDGFNLSTNGSGQFQVVDLANVTERNVGTFNPTDIETNDDFANGTAGQAPCP